MTQQTVTVEMIGTEKQIAWATDIRTQLISKFNSYRQQVLEQWGQDCPEHVRLSLVAGNWLITRQRSAIWFIDHRDWDGRDFVTAATDMIQRGWLEATRREDGKIALRMTGNR